MNKSQNDTTPSVTHDVSITKNDTCILDTFQPQYLEDTLVSESLNIHGVFYGTEVTKAQCIVVSNLANGSVDGNYDVNNTV